MRDFYNNVKVVRVISPVSVADDTAEVGQIIDRSGFESLTYMIATGALADSDATFAVLLEDGDAANLSDAAAVVDAELLGTEVLAGFQFDDDDETRKLGYIGNKRYSRLTITPTNNSGAALMSAIAVLSHAHDRPVA